MDHYVVTIFCLAVVVVSAAVIVLTRRLNEMRKTLDRTRSATYELTTMAQDDIKDLRTSLAYAGIEIHHEQLDERMRRMSLTPQQRHDESLAKFEETCRAFEAMWKEPDDTDRRDH